MGLSEFVSLCHVWYFFPTAQRVQQAQPSPPHRTECLASGKLRIQESAKRNMPAFWFRHIVGIVLENKDSLIDRAPK